MGNQGSLKRKVTLQNIGFYFQQVSRNLSIYTNPRFSEFSGEARKTAQLVKCQSQDPEFDSWNPCKNQVLWHEIAIPVLGRQ